MRRAHKRPRRRPAWRLSYRDKRPPPVQTVALTRHAYRLQPDMLWRRCGVPAFLPYRQEGLEDESKIKYYMEHRGLLCPFELLRDDREVDAVAKLANMYLDERGAIF